MDGILAEITIIFNGPGDIKAAAAPPNYIKSLAYGRGSFLFSKI